VIELSAAATSGNITVALAGGTYTLTAYATVVGEVASSSSVSVEIILPQFELLFESTGTVTFPQTSFDITGLSIGKNDELRMVYTLVGDSTSTADYDIRVNDITSNYHRQILSATGTTIGAGRATDSRFSEARSNQKTAGFADIKVSENSRFVVQSQAAERGIGAEANDIFNRNWNIINTDTVTSITKLTILCNRTNGIASGSRIRLYKVNTGDA
jgi:hypothetical protein